MSVPRALRLDGVLEDFSERWGAPFAPEFELGLFRRLFAAELRAELARLAKARTAAELERRGRARRLLGDPEAAADLRAALDLQPDRARAHAWLGEAGLGTEDGLSSLRRAVALDARDGWARVYLGAALILKKSFREAEKELKTGAGLLKKEALARVLLGIAQGKLGRRAAADASFRAALELQPSCSSAALLRSRLWKGTRAAAAAEDALDAEPDHAHVALFAWEPGTSWEQWLGSHAGFCLEQRGLPLCARFGLDETRFSPYPQEAAARAERALKLRGRRAWTLAVAGRALARVPGAAPDLRRRARALLDAAVAANPRAGWTWAWRALSRVGDDPRGALADLDRALALSPHYFRAYSWRGAVLRRLGKPRESLRDLDRSAAADERYPFSAHERSLTRRALGDLSGAALDLDRAYALDPRYSWVYAPGREPSAEDRARGLRELERAIAAQPSCVSLRAWRGELLWRSGRVGEAALALEAAAALDPSHALTQGFLGLVLLDAGRPAEALEPLSRACALDARHLAFVSGRAEALRRCGRAAGGERALAAALEERPKAWTLRLQRARWRLEDGRAAQALADARAAAALEGRDAEGWLLEARALSALKRHAQAEAAADRALAIAPNLGRAWLLRAEARRARGRAAEAVADFRVVHERFGYLLNEEQRSAMGAILGRA